MPVMPGTGEGDVSTPAGVGEDPIIETLRMQIEFAETQVFMLTFQVSELTKSLLAKTQALSLAELAAASIRQELIKRDEEIASLKTQIGKVREEYVALVNELRAKYNTSQQSLKSKDLLYQTALRSLSASRTEITGLNTRIAALVEENQTLASTGTGLGYQNYLLTQENDSLRASNAELTAGLGLRNTALSAIRAGLVKVRAYLDDDTKWMVGSSVLSQVLRTVRGDLQRLLADVEATQPAESTSEVRPPVAA